MQFVWRELRFPGPLCDSLQCLFFGGSPGPWMLPRVQVRGDHQFHLISTRLLVQEIITCAASKPRTGRHVAQEFIRLFPCMRTSNSESPRYCPISRFNSSASLMSCVSVVPSPSAQHRGVCCRATEPLVILHCPRGDGEGLHDCSSI